MEKYDILVIGAGPAGMMAASTAAASGKKVCLLERNEKAGRKLAISGKGRCNLTNTAADGAGLQENMISNPRFVMSAAHRFTNQDLMAMIEALGVPLKVERGGRVFPESDRAFDIVDALVKRCRKYKVRMLFSTYVQQVEKESDGFRVRTDKESFQAEKVIVATGGISYPTTGSTGDGYTVAETFGHTVREPLPALVPLVTQETWPRELMGLSLKNVGTRVTCGKKVICKDFGEMLFTHFGISGPVVLTAASRTQAWLRRQKTDFRAQPVIFHIDMKPALSEEQLDQRIRRDLQQFAKKQLLHALEELLPKRMIPIVIRLAELDPEKRADTLSAAEKRRLRETLKDIRCTIRGTRPVTEAIVTQGGVDVKEIDPGTMESRLVPGLYFAGEVIDIDALTGGFNLQIAFSTGYTAGVCAAANKQEED